MSGSNDYLVLRMNLKTENINVKEPHRILNMDIKEITGLEQVFGSDSGFISY